MHRARRRIRQSADPFTSNSLFSAFFARWISSFAAAPPQVAASSSPIGGNCATRGSDTPATRRRSVSNGANPHHHRRGERRGPGEPGRSAREQRQGAAIARQLAQGLHQSTTLFAQQQPRRAPPVQNSPSTPALTAFPVQNSPSTSRTALLPVQNSPSTPPHAACAVQNSPRSPEMAQFGAFSACRESFVPF